MMEMKKGLRLIKKTTTNQKECLIEKFATMIKVLEMEKIPKYFDKQLGIRTFSINIQHDLISFQYISYIYIIGIIYS